MTRERMVTFVLISIAIIVLGGVVVYYLSTQDQRAIRSNAGPAERTLRVTIDYTKPFAQLFKRETYGEGLSGSDARDNISEELFPVSGTGTVTVDVLLVKFGAGETLSYDEVPKGLAERGLAPARIEHLFAIHDQYPDLHLFNQGSIFALGSVWTRTENGKQVRKAPALATGSPHVLSAHFVSTAVGEPAVILSEDWFAALKI